MHDAASLFMDMSSVFLINLLRIYFRNSKKSKPCLRQDDKLPGTFSQCNKVAAANLKTSCNLENVNAEEKMRNVKGSTFATVLRSRWLKWSIACFKIQRN